MATLNLARFTINGVASEVNGKRGYDATPGEVLTLTLEQNPARVLTVTYELYDAAVSTSPLNSLYDTEQVFDDNGLKSITLSTPNSAVTVTLDGATDISAYTFRATVVTATGTHVFERLVVVRKNGLRMTVPAETIQYSQRGWSDALNEVTKALADGGVLVPLVSSADTGSVASFPAGQGRIFNSDGATAGGSWAVITEARFTSAVDDAAIVAGKLKPGADTQVLTTSGGVTVWAANVTLNPPTDPGDDGKVAVASAGDLTYSLVTDAHIDAAAAITPSKIAAGANGQVLKTVAGVTAWSIDDQLFAPINPTDDGKVALATSGNLVYGFISDFQVDAAAAIAVTKLATGTEGYVLKVIAGVPTWAVEGGGGANLPANPADDDKMAFGKTGNLAYADGVKLLNPGTTQDGLASTAFFLNGGTGGTPPLSEPLTGDNGYLWQHNNNLWWATNLGSLNVLRSSQPVAGSDDFNVARAGGGVLFYDFLTDAMVDASADIAITKLAAGGVGDVLVTNAGPTPAWATIVDANINAAAGISVSKFAVGTAGQYLRTIGGVSVWSSDLDGADLVAESVPNTAMSPGGSNDVLRTLAGGTSVEWGKIANSNIASAANIAVSKIALGAANSLLASDGASNFWSTTPTVASLNATSFLKSEGYLELTNSAQPSAPPAGDVRMWQEVGSGATCLFYDDNSVVELSTEPFDL